MKKSRYILYMEWVKCNHAKYYRYFDEWYDNLTDIQLEYFIKALTKK